MGEGGPSGFEPELQEAALLGADSLGLLVARIRILCDLERSDILHEPPKDDSLKSIDPSEARDDVPGRAHYCWLATAIGKQMVFR